MTVGRVVIAYLAVLGLFGAVLVSGVTASAAGAPAATHFAECNSVLVGPRGGEKTATAVTNSDNTVTLTVTVSFPEDSTGPKPGEHVFDCVFDGTPGTTNMVGSTGTPGADCASQGLPCTFKVTTEALSPGAHNLCDIARFEGFGEGASGRRTPEFCLTVTIPQASTPTPTPTPTTPPTSSPSPAVPGMPNTGLGGSNPYGLILMCLLVASGTLTLGLGAHLIRRRG